MVVPFLESPLSLCARIGTHEPLRVRSAGFRACGFGRLSSRPFVVHRTRKSGEPAGWKACATSRFMKSPLSFFRMQRDPEPFRAPGQGIRPTSCRPGALTGRFMESFRGSRSRIGTVNRSCRRKKADIGVDAGNPPPYVGGYESTVHQKQHLCVLFVKVCIGGYQPACCCHCKFDGCLRISLRPPKCAVTDRGCVRSTSRSTFTGTEVLGPFHRLGGFGVLRLVLRSRGPVGVSRYAPAPVSLLDREAARLYHFAVNPSTVANLERLWTARAATAVKEQIPIRNNLYASVYFKL
jgi:hypothetical protein